MPIHLSPDPWVLSTDRWDETYRGAYLGNGYMGGRFLQTGTSITPGEDTPAFIVGHYVRESLLPVPPLLPLRFRAGERLFGADRAHVKKYHQELRLREGILLTRATWDTGQGEADLEIETALLRGPGHHGNALLRARVENRSRGPVLLEVPDAESVGEPGSFTVKSEKSTCAGHLRALEPASLEPDSAGVVAYTVAPGASAQFGLLTRLNSEVVPAGHTAPDEPLTSESVEGLLKAHRESWEQLWASDVEIEGDPEAQQVVRACLFYLLSSIRDGSAAGVPPMGMSSHAFTGHVFWDMDSWMFPALLPQHPDLARAMLDYRSKTLPGARENAKAEGLPGAQYAWESGLTGRETLTDAVFRHGRHVSGDVALALKQYYTATGDSAWRKSVAWPILKDTADNWAARAKPDGKGGLVVKGVTTPDENAGQVDGSAWTHHVAGVNLRFAAETARAVGGKADPTWEKTAAGLGYLRDAETKLILPYQGFTGKTKAKQADVLLLAFPGEARLPKEELGRMYDFYAPRVIETGPAMTDAIHAVVAARLARGEEAMTRFRASYRPFVRPPFHLFSEKRTRDNLCFLTGAAGVVEAVLYGFAGLHLEPDAAQPDRPKLEPHLPAEWKSVRLRNLQWRGKAWDVEFKPGAPPVWTGRSGG